MRQKISQRGDGLPVFDTKLDDERLASIKQRRYVNAVNNYITVNLLPAQGYRRRIKWRAVSLASAPAMCSSARACRLYMKMFGTTAIPVAAPRIATTISPRCTRQASLLLEGDPLREL